MHISVFFFSFVVLFTFCSTEDTRPCNLAFRCSYADEPVWTTTDNKSCQVFRNGCLLASTNCDRRNNYKREARVIGQEKCQKLCKTSCAVDNNTIPICGYYNEEKRNFESQCEMDNIICATGKTFSLFSVGLCPGPETS